MNSVVVDIADMDCSGNPDDELVTYSLGSCLGITVYDPVVKIGGMIHCMLPLSKVDKEKAKTRPYMFIDTGMVKFLGKLFDMGVQKRRSIVRVAGGSCVLDHKGLFRIGERNYTVLRKILWKNGMLIDAEDVGGDITRTVRMDIATGRMTIKSNGTISEL